MTIFDFFSPIIEFSFMQRALIGSTLVAISAPLVGVMLVLRRMSLAADSLAHSIFPGVAIGFILFGLSLPAMSIGGLVSGLLVAVLTGSISRTSILKEDACLVSLYVISVALGITILSTRSTNIDIMSILFGSVLGLDNEALFLLASVSCITIIFLIVFYRLLIIETIDPNFMRSFSKMGVFTHILFLIVVMLNLVAGLQALGTLLSVGAMMLPSVTALLWSKSLPKIMAIACGVCLFSNIFGLLISFHFNLPAGPAMILVSGALYGGSLVFVSLRGN